ncbi:ATP-grasp domain-containing protein [Ralstonia wenshanensis]|uniref:ATP-grasp domain-containing protein n=1 Tax=Ralstonia wenshanensis TaxID=2842456 RepID=UPI0039C5E297
MSNVLLLSAGRRVELVEAFKIEIAARKLGGRVYATDLQPDLSAACQIADRAFKAPRVTDPGYIDFLLQTCLAEGIRLVVPTIDTELLLLARSRTRFAEAGVHLIISDESLIALCRDKRKTSDLFTQLGIDTPRIYERSAISFPCFAKPYDGSCSVGAAVLPRPDALTPTMFDDEKMMFMEYIDPTHIEFTVDVYYDRMGQLKCAVPRQRIEVRGGEVSKGATRRHFVYEYLLPRLAKLRGARGCITVQVFANETIGRFAALEINPRFGGGYPLSYSAGANYPGWLIDEYLLGREIKFFDKWENNLLMLRYDAKVLVRENI